MDNEIKLEIKKQVTDKENSQIDYREKGEHYYNPEKWVADLESTIEYAKNAIGDEFFIAVHIKREEMIDAVLESSGSGFPMFFPRISCPTPTYDQFAYKFDGKDLHLLWYVPTELECREILKNKDSYEDKQVVHYVESFYNGTLDKIACAENKEEYSLGLVPIVVLDHKGDIHA